MKLDVRFEGPCADDMVAHGAIDIGRNEYDHVFVGKGETRAVAASRALGAIAESANAHLLDPASDKIRETLSLMDAWNLEADGFLCNVYCIIRITE